MTSKIARSTLQLIALSILWIAGPSSACTLAESLKDSDERIVIIGQIRDYQAIPDNSEPAYGIVVDVLAEFDNIGVAADRIIVLPRAGLGADCTSHYFKNVSQLEARYPLESLITVVYDIRRDLAEEQLVLRGADLRVLEQKCVLEDVADEQRDYSTPDNPCSSYMFQGAKDIAELPVLSQDMRVATLTRLADFPSVIYFEELVNKYVSGREERAALMAKRYADAMERGCARRPDVVVDFGDGYFDRRRIRGRWFEYCTDERRAIAKRK